MSAACTEDAECGALIAATSSSLSSRMRRSFPTLAQAPRSQGTEDRFVGTEIPSSSCAANGARCALGVCISSMLQIMPTGVYNRKARRWARARFSSSMSDGSGSSLVLVLRNGRVACSDGAPRPPSGRKGLSAQRGGIDRRGILMGSQGITCRCTCGVEGETEAGRRVPTRPAVRLVALNASRAACKIGSARDFGTYLVH